MDFVRKHKLITALQNVVAAIFIIGAIWLVIDSDLVTVAIDDNGATYEVTK